MFDYPAFAALIRAKRGESKISQENLATDAFGDPGRKSDISRIENGKKKPNEATIQRLCEALGITEAEIAPIRNPATVSEQFDNLATLSQEQLQNLAARFGIDNPFDTAPAELRRLLTLKADEYRALKAEVEAIDDGLKRLSNLKTAAQDAIARGDLDEVEEMLQRVQEVELDEAAKTAELRARNALLRGRVEQAYALLCAAADSFAPVDPLEPARRRIKSDCRFFPILYLHGLRYGGCGLELAALLIAPAMTEKLKAADPQLWGAGQNNLGAALRNQGIRTAGAAGAELLGEAVAAYRDALTVRTREDHPVDWAMTQNNLGIALQEQGIRTAGANGAELLGEAVAAYRAALTVYTREDHPVDWAMTQNNLGNALTEQGIRTAGAAGAELLAEAVAACRDALTVRTREDHPVDWAGTQNNLGIALRNQGSRTAGGELANGAELMGEAVAAYRAALSVRTREDHPVDWAVTQENIAIAEEAIADHDGTANPRPHLKAALSHVEAALEVYDPEHMSYNHDKAARFRDRLRARLDGV